MLKNPFNQFLCNAVAEVPAGGAAPAAAAPAAPAAATVQPAAPGNGPPPPPAGGEPGAAAPAAAATPPAATAEPTMLQKVAAVARDKAVIIAERDQAVTRATQLETSLGTVTKERDDARAELQTLKAERTEMEKLLSGTQAEVKSAEEKAATIVATTMGVDPAKLPDQQKEGSTVEALYVQLEKAEDPQEIFRINAKINAEEARLRAAN